MQKKIINYEKKKMIPLTNKENKSYLKQKIFYICRKEFSTNNDNKVKDHCHYTGNIEALLLMLVN